MHKRIKLLLTALIALVACSVAAGSASANRSIGIRGGPNVTAESRLTFKAGEGIGRGEIICDITLLRTITNLIPKIEGTLFGKVTGVRIDRGTGAEHCRTAGAIRRADDIIPLADRGVAGTHSEDRRGNLLYDVSRARRELWKLIYDSPQGILPEIEGINFHIQKIQFLLRFTDVFNGRSGCLYEGDAYGLIEVRRRVITRATAIETRTALRLITRLEGICPEPASFAGEFTVRPTLTIELL